MYIPIQKNIASRIEGRKQLIPYIIHQTNEFDKIPADMVMAMETVIENNPEYAFRYYNATERRDIIEKEMGQTVVAAYDKLVALAFKADLFRYVLVYMYGGCYFDSGLIYLEHLRDTIRPEDTFVSSPDGSSMFINNAFFCATVQHPIILNTIKKIVKRAANNEPGLNLLDVTGPAIMARGFKEYFDYKLPIEHSRNYSDGVRLLTQVLDLYECRLYNVYDSGLETILTYNKYPKYAWDMSVYSGMKSYWELYSRGQIYNKSIQIKIDEKFPMSLDPNDDPDAWSNP